MDGARGGGAERVLPKARPRGRAGALALIRKELAKKGVRGAEGEAEDVVDALYEAYEEGGAVPTREAFAERCANEEVAQAVLGMGSDPFTKRKLSKNGIIAICAGCVLAVALIGGVLRAVAARPQDSHSAEGAVISETEKQDETDEADGAMETSEDGETNEGAGTDGQATDEGAQQGEDNAGNSSGDDSNASAGGSGGSGSSGSTQTQQPSHTHNWVPVTTTIHHDAVYKTVHHDAVTEERSMCNSCGADITGNESAHMKEYALKGDMSHSYSIKTVVVQNAYDEQVLVSNAWDETVTTGYRCSTCGATR